MKAKEKLVSPNSDYYLYQPSTLASKLYLYPKELGCFFYEPGYWRSRIQYNSFLLMYIIKGACQVLLPDKPLQTAAAGQVVLIDCYVPHEYGFNCETEVAWIHFDGLLARNFYELISSRHGNILSPSNPFPITNGFDQLLHTFRASKPQKEDVFSEILTQMLNSLLHTSPSSENKLSHSKIVEKSRAYINEHFSEPLTLEQIARNVNMSPFHFSRVFTAQTGFTPHQYLIAARINSAKFLLKQPNVPVKEIAFGSGFNSESSFCSTFRKWENMTPSEYREQMILSSKDRA